MRSFITEAGLDAVGSSPWYALHTRHQHEKSVAELLTSKGFEVFLPLYSTVHRWKDRAKQLSLPLFPCYVFLQGGLDRKMQVITTPGVHGVVGTAGHAGIIPELEIAAIRLAIESKSSIEPYPFLQCGDRVRITSGSLAGLEGILVRKQSQTRLVLSVDMIGRSVALEVDLSMVEPIRESSPLQQSPLALPSRVNSLQSHAVRIDQRLSL